MGHKFKPIEIGGRWWEPITSVCSKKCVMSFVRTLKKYSAEYIIRNKHGFRFQLYIPKEEYDRVDKEYGTLNSRIYKKKKKIDETT